MPTVSSAKVKIIGVEGRNTTVRKCVQCQVVSRFQTRTLSATQTATPKETLRASCDAFESEAPSEFASAVVSKLFADKATTLVSKEQSYM